MAVLRSGGLMPDAGIDDLLRYLGRSDNPPAFAGISCDPDRKSATTAFPAGQLGLGWNEPDELGCGDVRSPYVPPYSLPVLDLNAAVTLAEREAAESGGRRP